MEWLLSYIVLFILGVICLWKILVVKYPWLSDDLAYISFLAKFSRQIKKYDTNFITPPDQLEIQSKNIPDKVFILYEDKEYTYSEMNEWVNKYSHAMQNLGIKNKDKVGILMMNEPAFLATWFAANRIGAVAVFLNYNLKAKQLLHCIKLAEVKMLIVGDEPTIHEVSKDIEYELNDQNIALYNYGPETAMFKSMPRYVEQESSERVVSDWKVGRDQKDALCYIFTSGTTGLPKAVNIKNRRLWILGLIPSTIYRPDDIVYCSLPLYHGSPSGIGVLGVLNKGITIALRKKFSASQLWNDCRKYNATLFLYIGETMRYVCKQPKSPEDRNHKVRGVIGNGLRPTTWRTFLDRFGENIKVHEFYGATEGNAGLVNLNGSFGNIGTLGPLLQLILPLKIVKFDVKTETIVKDKNGKPMKPATNEPGLVIAKITKFATISNYKGDKSLTEKKKIRDLYKKGDEYFNTGDMMMLDEKYRLHFCDRVGDTFRWKGENVSTNEVSDILVQARGVKEANVYGVNIPGCEGRAGMVSLILDDSTKFDGSYLYTYVCNNLSSYARPIFIRIQEKLELTGSFKQTKFNLQKEGFDLEQVKNEIYFYDILGKSYVPFTKEIQEKINNEELKF